MTSRHSPLDAEHRALGARMTAERAQEAAILLLRVNEAWEERADRQEHPTAVEREQLARISPYPSKEQ